eukprot:11207745-Lingulodinium_polyedra.AAC.1
MFRVCPGFLQLRHTFVCSPIAPPGIRVFPRGYSAFWIWFPSIAQSSLVSSPKQFPNSPEAAAQAVPQQRPTEVRKA